MPDFHKLALVCAAVTALTVTGSLAQTTTAPAQSPETFTPTVGQGGKDVIWVPTHQTLVDRMLEMAKVTKDDYVIDLGSGDGRTVITAAKLGARAHGIEYNPNMVALSRRNAQAAGIADRATFVEGDIFKSDFSDATVIALFLLPDLNLRIRSTLLDMKPGTRVVSNTFDMDDWKADDRVSAVGECTGYCNAYLWIIPAKVEGKWRMGNADLALTQTYQMLSGTLTQGGQTLEISDAKMVGRSITFTAGGKRYSGQVSETGTMSGTIEGGAKWSATRSNS
jgi:hypothetical protein